MSNFEWMTLLISVLAVIVIPLLVLVIRGVVKWSNIENALSRLNERIDVVAADLKEFMTQKEKSHTQIYEQMTNDRQATDRRLRWLEEHQWKGSGGNAL